jgi:hypothetical protein
MNLETTHHAAKQRSGPEEQLKELSQSHEKSAAEGA